MLFFLPKKNQRKLSNYTHEGLAVVAGRVGLGDALLPVEPLAKVVQLQGSATVVKIVAVVHDLAQIVQVGFYGLGVASVLGLLDYAPVPVHVAVVVHQNAVRRLAVPTGSSALLVVALHGLRHRGVYHESDVRLVYAHSECYGGANDLYLKQNFYFNQEVWFQRLPRHILRTRSEIH